MFQTVAVALVPVVLLIALGALFRARRLFSPGFWAEAERLCYFVLLPALFFHGLATARLDDLPIAGILLSVLPALLLVAGLTLALRPVMGVDGPGFTSIFQGAIRFNNYVAVTLAVALYGAPGLALAALCNAVIVPTVNVLSVLVFARHGAVRMGAGAVLRQIATNPLVLASAAGILWRFTGIALPVLIEPALRVLGGAALPLGLLCVGAALAFGEAARWKGPVLFSSGLKFLALPLAVAGGAWVSGLSGVPLGVVLLFSVMPTASSAYILARQLGGDAPLMAGITAAQTILALLAVPLVFAGLAAVLPL